MKNVFFLLFLSITAFASAQAITEEQIIMMVNNAQEECVGAHQNIVLRTNEEFAKTIWGQTVRFNEAKVIKFFNRPSGEKALQGFDIYGNNKAKWGYSYDSKTTEALLTSHGVRVTQSRGQAWIIAKQNLLYAESMKDGKKIILELYCPYQEFLELLRIGKTQSIEFLITGFSGSASTTSKISGVLTQVNTEKQTIKCSNGHEYDKDTGYKFCPTCGEPLE